MAYLMDALVLEFKITSKCQPITINAFHSLHIVEQKTIRHGKVGGG